MNKQQDNILVSVWMITYNHEKYITQAINSVLAQKGSFNIELVIGVDKSTDKTAEIVKSFKHRYPDLIKPIYHSTNVGMMVNMLDTIERCNGQYIALLEGDDYWIYENKLQEQVNFLEQNKEYSFCFHNAKVVYDNGNKSHLFSELENTEYQANQVLQNWLIPTPSVIFRNFQIQWPPFVNKCVHGDILLFLLLFDKGKAFAFDKTWCAYRKNSNSVTNSNQLNEDFVRKVLYQNKLMNRFFHFRFKNEFEKQKIYWTKALLSIYIKKKNYFRLLTYGIPFFFHLLIIRTQTKFK